VVWAFTTGHASNWHPLTWLSLQLDAQLFGTQAWGYHLTNLVLHVANALLLLLLLWKMTGAWWPSALVAALFAVHPLHVESVAWVTERKDVLSTLFGFLALLAYAGYVKRPGLARYLLVLLAFGASLLAKAMLVTLPFVLLLLDYWPLGRYRLPGAANIPASSQVPLARLLWEKMPLLVLAAGSSAATWYVQQHGRSVQQLAQLPFTARVGNAVVAYVVYLRKMLWPADLAVYYPHPGSSLPAWQVAGAALVLIATTIVVLRLWRRAPYLAVGWFWYLGTLVPVIGLVQVGTQALADRYTYVPLVGIFIAVVWGGADLAARCAPRDRYLLGAGAAVVVFVCVLLTWLQVHHWNNGLTLWHQALTVEPHSSLAHSNFATVLLDEAASPDDEQLAFKHFAEAVAIEPNYIAGHMGLGLLLLKRGRADQAVQHLRLVVRLDPESMKAQHLLAAALAAQGQWTEAEHHQREAVRLDPDQPENHYVLGELLRTQGKLKEAIVCFRRAVELGPPSVARHCALALALYDDGQVDPAMEQYRQATRLDPHWPEGANQAARRLATHPLANQRDGVRAVDLAREACHGTGERRPQFLDTLAAAYAEVGRYDEAMVTLRKALDVARAEGRTDYLGKGQERLKLYERHQPLREPPS